MNNNSKTLLAFILGAAAGAAIGYFLASENKDELLEDLKDTATKVKDNLQAEVEKGKQIMEELKGKVNDLIERA